MSDQRMIRLADMWQRKSANGNVYFSGYLGRCQLLMFKEGKKPHPTKPDEEIVVWRLFVQERDPDRRLQARQVPKQEAPALEAAVAEWSGRFTPDDEPGF